MTSATTRSSSGSDEMHAGPTADELLSCLEDQYTRQIVTALQDGPMPARDIVAACDCSRPTVYRRLKELKAATVVTTAMRYDPDGHHRKVFTLQVDQITLKLQSDGIIVHTS
ncbi:winged helix-turn-helix transcriptional regulator [Haloarcula sp. JP-Z28]|uniref:ArsR family transcriptional regulator n=2 Tax=Haloarcula marismortui TaxID=2238 RepID=Q5UWQ9_HALMA|nr:MULTISPECIES: winged helix-turn-helix domain-containing protein [Haloarcula]AAV48294.1 transcription regulator [Haloarcula marismortui ATCC 43049]EMA07882.1 transcriptional regulator [Haloarcula sinaiiensis ATCC 33800]NHN64739.1 winged helix-turn-helix transcriptional regulator [Haloarcula sp. JP-Z28]QCP89832.1 ArsR family transcriptional regulator [Haloarcula marismortui ATCC 43049]QUJ73914.1 winged helix-turn-helix transcriptional regulator [Haloarcula sinaiiensis ATCC 33800]